MTSQTQERVVLAGSLVVLVLSILLARHGVEPVATWLYPVAWWCLIVLLDGLVHRRKGESLMTSGGGEVAWLCGASVVFWVLYEILNLRVENWYYVNVPRLLPLRAFGEVVSFATVLPALFEIADLLEAYGLFGGPPPPEVRLSSRGETTMIGMGIGCVVLPLALPAYAYPLIWFAPFLVIEPFLHRRGLPCLLRDFEIGQTRRFKLLLASGLVCGLLWEACNAQARSHWYYTIPGFGWPYYFRMPFAGLLGFLPFTLSAYSFWVFADTLRGGRGFRLAEWPQEHEARLAAAPASTPYLKAWIAGASIVAALGLLAMNRYTVDSVRPRLADIEGAEKHASLLDGYGLDDPFALASRAYGWRGAQLALEEGFPLGAVGEVVDRAAFLTVAGLGAANVRLLEKAGVRSVEQLARCSPDSLQHRLAVAYDKNPILPRRPSILKVRIWVAEARRLESGQ